MRACKRVCVCVLSTKDDTFTESVTAKAVFAVETPDDFASRI